MKKRFQAWLDKFLWEEKYIRSGDYYKTVLSDDAKGVFGLLGMVVLVGAVLLLKHLNLL